MSEPFRIFYDHQLLAEHPPGANWRLHPVPCAPPGTPPDCVVIDRDGKMTIYPGGSYHGGGHGATCAGPTHRDDCPGCTGR